MCRVRVGLATLRDKVYVLRLRDKFQTLEDSSTVVCIDATGNEVEIESRALRRVQKVSTISCDNEDQQLVIVFPYERSNLGALIPWTTRTQERLPMAMSYLIQHQETLEQRGHSVRTWFEYGSTQGLETVFGPKILVPPMSRDGRLFLSEFDDSTIFSGYGIFFSGDLRQLHTRLSQPDFQRYARQMGRTLRGGWFSMSKTSISKFALTEPEWKALGAWNDPTRPSLL